jgi:hypothetical protein
MRRWLPLLLPGMAMLVLFVVLSILPIAERGRLLILVTGTLVLATIIAAVFTKSTSTVRALLALLLWSLVLFELLGS